MHLKIYISKAKVFVVAMLFAFSVNGSYGQTVSADYRNIDIGGNGFTDYTRTLILLHEMYNGSTINPNYAIGTITALRGSAQAYNRTNIVNINSTSSYNLTSASFSSLDNNGSWALKTCMYNGKKYLALDVPYAHSYHDHAFKFSGWINSTAESLKAIAYENLGQPVNTSVLSDVRDYVVDMNEKRVVNNFIVSGNVGIGIDGPTERLSVNGKIRAKEVKVEVANWPDYVFEERYELISLPEMEQFIKSNARLPGMPSAMDIVKNGLSLGELVTLQQKQIEELTLHLIEKEKQLNIELERNNKQDKRLAELEKNMLNPKHE